MEIWKDIKGYEGKYQVSNLGNVKSLERFRTGKSGSKVYVPEKLLKGKIDKDGYVEYALCVGEHKKAKYYRAHRLVAEAFLPNHNNNPIVNHKDENPQNNCVENLEWCSEQYNTRYSISVPVLQYSINGDFIRKWDCITEIQDKLHIYRSSICACCKGKHKTAGGYKWEYEKVA